MTPPRLIVGLGNPGPEYEATRHNAGFWFVDRLAEQLKLSLAPQAKFFGKAARAGELWLLQPTTFMNRSGQAVAALANFYKIPSDAILIAHDELDLDAFLDSRIRRDPGFEPSLTLLAEHDGELVGFAICRAGTEVAASAVRVMLP